MTLFPNHNRHWCRSWEALNSRKSFCWFAMRPPRLPFLSLHPNGIAFFRSFFPPRLISLLSILSMVFYLPFNLCISSCRCQGHDIWHWHAHWVWDVSFRISRDRAAMQQRHGSDSGYLCFTASSRSVGKDLWQNVFAICSLCFCSLALLGLGILLSRWWGYIGMQEWSL